MKKTSELQQITQRYFQRYYKAIVYYHFDQTLFEQITSSLTQYERPDMLSVLDDRIIGFEHFVFDSYDFKRSQGSDLLRKEHELHNKILQQANEELKSKNSVLITETIPGTSSLQNYIKNFKRNFISHYQKIDSYIDNIKSNFGSERRVSIYFFIEDCTILGNSIKLERASPRFREPLLPIHVSSIVTLLLDHPKIQFLFFGSQDNGNHILTIIENFKEALNRFQQENTMVTTESFFHLRVQN